MKRGAALFLAALLVISSPASVQAAWQQGERGWRYEEEGTWFKEGWKKIHDTWYYFDDSGLMKTGWLLEQGGWYYLRADGAMATGWIYDKADWYFLNASGVMRTGWVLDGNRWYYLDMQTGRMLKNTVTPDGYAVDADGGWPAKGSGGHKGSGGGGGSGGGSHGGGSGGNHSSNTGESSSGAVWRPNVVLPHVPGGKPEEEPEEKPEENIPDIPWIPEDPAPDPGAGDENLATPPEASEDIEQKDRERLERYIERGLYLEADNQETVRAFVEPRISAQETSMIFIGVGFYPYSYLLNQQRYPTVSKVTVKNEEITVDGVTYYIAHLTIAYQHQHEYVTEVIEPSCLLDGLRITTCKSGDFREEIVIPALGHEDLDGDFICDRDYAVLPVFQKGDRQTVKTGLPEPYDTMTFTCLDENYKGGILFVADEVIPQSLAVPYDEADGNYTWSQVRQWLDFHFADSLSVADNLLPVMLGETEDAIADRVFCLSKAEIRSTPYREILTRPWAPESGKEYYWTRTADDDYSNYAYAVQYNGHLASDVVSSRRAGLRPAYVLKNPNVEEPLKNRWMRGDVQEREIAGETYIFRCIDPDYADVKGSHAGALFLCDTIIGGNIQIFGENGTWESSALRAWLSSWLSNQQGIEPVETTLRNAYAGLSGGYDAALSLEKFTKETVKPPPTSDKIFCLSLEEAVRYRDILWKLEGADKNNFTQGGSYSAGYWLRTPAAWETTKTYCVTYAGSIEANETTNTKIGIRPAFVAAQ